jgi:hypothetical protein
MILDIIEWRDSPRIRDRISHGAVDPRQIPQSLVDRTVLLALALLQKYDYKQRHDPLEYEPVYHPQLVLYEELRETVAHMEIFYNEEATKYVSSNGVFDEIVTNKNDALVDNANRILLINTLEEVRTYTYINDLHNKAQKYMLEKYGRGSSFSFHHKDYVAIQPIDQRIIPYAVPLVYDRIDIDRAPGNTISAILGFCRVCSDVRESISAVKETYNKAKAHRIRQRAEQYVQKFENNMHVLYLLLVALMRETELFMLSIENPNMETLKIVFFLSASVHNSINGNSWPRLKLINSYLEAMRLRWTKVPVPVEKPMTMTRVTATGGDVDGERFSVTVDELKNDTSYDAIILEGSKVSCFAFSPFWGERARIALQNDGILTETNDEELGRTFQLTRNFTFSDLKKNGLRIMDRQQLSKFVTGKLRLDAINWLG